MSAESSNLWRECVQYLIRANILDQHHKVNWPNSDILDFAQILRDGVLLCQLANRLSKGCIDMREISLRPQLSQFLCLKNICLFLGSCQQTFNIPQRELFEAWQLYKVSDFGKILLTLSKLSKTEVALRSGVPGFPDQNEKELGGNEHEYYNDEIYRTLAEEAESKELEEEIYDAGSDAEEYGKIYDCIVMQRPKQAEEFVPKDKRDYCIKEMLDTEKNYVEALNMLLQKFYTPLREVLSPDDHRIVFMNMQELAQIHTAFHSELGKAVRASQGFQSKTDSPGGARPAKIGEVFVRWKPKFVAYSEYCSKLTIAQNRIERLCTDSSCIRQKIVECQADANQNRFRLQDLLSVPMQRVLKYHLLLKELTKSTATTHEDKPSLDVALDAMLDLSLYINEVKRDCETLQIIKDIQSSIVDLNMPENTELSDYGRLLKDGEMRLCSHQDRQRVKNRYVFVFDKVMLICKNVKANQYTYKNAVVLGEYQIEEAETDNNNKGLGTLIKSSIPKWSYSWLMVHTEGRNVLQLYAKSLEQKTAWISAIKMAHDNVKPSAANSQDHKFQFCGMESATECSQCGKLLRGLFYQGYKCSVCCLCVHKECIAGSSGCGRPKPPPRNPRSQSFNVSDVSSQGQRFRAVKSFHGNNGGPEFLCFNENDVIELATMNTDMEGWWKGRIVEGRNQDRVGFFPAEYVRKQRISSVSAPRRWDTWHPGNMRASLELDSPVAPMPRSPIMHSRNPSRDSTISIGSTINQQQIAEGGPMSPAPPTPRKSGYINLEEVENHLWFGGSLDREMAENRLQGLANGTYLVRYSEKQARYAVSISYDGEVKHLKVEQGTDGYWLDEGTAFPSIVELISHYSTHNLQESFQALNTSLKAPLRSAVVSYAVALHNFEASAPNMLSLRKGDQVMVLSKNGNERGWWKGKVAARVGYFPLAYVTEVETNSSQPQLNQ